VKNLAIALGVCLALVFSSALRAEEGEKKKEAEKDVKIALDQVPDVVKAAAVKAVDGLKLTEAEKETKKDGVVYELEGTGSDGKTWEVKVDAAGKVLKKKVEEKDGDEEKDDDKDDDDKK
jgi:uncharacterized membrane protein YkoI